MLRWLTERRRKRLLETPFPAEWTNILERNVAAYKLLDADEQQRLRELVQVFVAEKHWEGAGGLELDDEIRVTIAGTGCQLVLGRDHDLFAEVESIVVYPSSVVVPASGRSMFDPGARPTEEDRPVLGVAHRGGALVLAWDSALRGARDPKDGRNVVIHELAHKIDFLDGAADGTPPLPSGSARRAWITAFAPAYLAHKERADRGQTSFLDDYAVTNEAEYFAVASEAFFEKPRALARELPDVYAALRQFYSLDLAAR
ncbi:MAG TPA: M90 family metallopeptidase [Kofleriaceae bacterium]